MTFKRLLTSILALAVFALPASASLFTYNDAASFNAADTDQAFQNVTFDAFVGQNFTTFTDALTTIAFSDGNVNGMLAAANPGGNWPSGAVLQTTTGGRTITVAVPSAAQAYGMNIGQLLAASTITISITNLLGDHFIHSFNQSDIHTPLFFGFRTSSAITSFTITADYGGAELALNGVELGTPDSQTPEVATLLMIGSGLIFFRFLRRFRAPQQA